MGDRKAEEEQREIERQDKALADYRAQLGRSFEHEARLKELLAKQAQLNAALDLDKHEAQVVAEEREPEEKALPAGFSWSMLRSGTRTLSLAKMLQLETKGASRIANTDEGNH